MQLTLNASTGKEVPRLAKNPHAQALGALGGKVRTRKGAATLSDEEKTAFAKMGALARWKDKKAVDSGNRLPHTNPVTNENVTGNKP
jgi:hypothetical protein